MTVTNLAASIRARLLSHARTTGTEFTQVLSRYALERVLYRLDQSVYRDRFLLKGALLFDLWFDEPHRPTRDADLLGSGESGLDAMEAIFREICTLPVEDGIHFDAKGVRAAQIREDARYGGVRVTFTGLLDGARCPVQVDIGFGDAVTPGPEQPDFPTLLDGMPAPRLSTYPRYTVVAEKTEILVAFGMANSRMKDFFDLWTLARRMDFEGDILCQALTATFERRKTPRPTNTPLALTREFSGNPAKVAQWNAFLRKNRLPAPALPGLITELEVFLWSPLQAAGLQQPFNLNWPEGGPWR